MKPSQRRWWFLAVEAGGLPFEFAAAVGLLAWAGWWLDGRFGTTPAFLATGALLGVAVAAARFWSLVKRFQAAQRDEDEPASPRR